ncbi:class B sortase [Blautia pseudococcoides]|nr:class B sortase [Blautia pseudococcoides]
MDYRNQKDFSDEKAIIYGHNMKDGSMFAPLKNLNLANRPKAVIFTESQTFEYELLFDDYVGASDKIYQLIGKKEENDVSRTLILSTCSNDGKKRHIIHGELMK